MPPHCDTLDGPVVRAARRALEGENLDLVLPFVDEAGEAEVAEAFRKVMLARRVGGVAREVADRYFFETVVRVHRAGEGAAYTGLKPAGLDVGPVIPVAERAIESGSARELLDVLVGIVRDEVERRLHHVVHLRQHADGGVPAARAAVQASLGLQVWTHGVYVAATAEGHGAGHEHRHTEHAAA